MKRYDFSYDYANRYEDDKGSWVLYDEAQAEVDALQSALNLMNKTAEVIHKETEKLKADRIPRSRAKS